jgi:hypothetical protein
MGLKLFMATGLVVLAPGLMTAAAQEKVMIDLRSDRFASGLQLPESAKEVYGIRLTVRVDKKGEGKGVLELDANVPVYDEFGFPTTGTDLPPVKLECSLKFVKKKKVQQASEARLGAPLEEKEWLLFEINGPKITSRLFLAAEETTSREWAQLLVHGKDGKIRYAVPVTPVPRPTKLPPIK